MMLYQLILMLLFGTLSSTHATTEVLYRTITVQEFPLDAPFYNTLKEDFFDLVYLYPYKKKFFLSYPDRAKNGFYAFRYKKDGSIIQIDDQDLLIFLGRNNLPTPPQHHTMKRDYAGYFVPIFLLFIIFIPIFLLYKRRKAPRKKKITGYLRGKKKLRNYFK